MPFSDLFAKMVLNNCVESQTGLLYHAVFIWVLLEVNLPWQMSTSWEEGGEKSVDFLLARSSVCPNLSLKNFSSWTAPKPLIAFCTEDTSLYQRFTHWTHIYLFVIFTHLFSLDILAYFNTHTQKNILRSSSKWVTFMLYFSIRSSFMLHIRLQCFELSFVP